MSSLRGQTLFALVLGTQLLSGGCDFPVMPGAPTGALQVRVIDTRENPVAGAEVLTPSLIGDSLQSLGRTGRDGILQARGMLVGFASIHVDPPAGFVTAANQANPVRVRIESERTTKIVFRLSRSPNR